MLFQHEQRYKHHSALILRFGLHRRNAESAFDNRKYSASRPCRLRSSEDGLSAVSDPLRYSNQQIPAHDFWPLQVSGALYQAFLGRTARTHLRLFDRRTRCFVRKFYLDRCKCFEPFCVLPFCCILVRGVCFCIRFVSVRFPPCRPFCSPQRPPWHARTVSVETRYFGFWA